MKCAKRAYLPAATFFGAGRPHGGPDVDVEVITDRLKNEGRVALRNMEGEPSDKDVNDDHETRGAVTKSSIDALLSDNDYKVANIAGNGDLSLDEKMRQIGIIKHDSVFWKSPRWATLLEVSDSRIRQAVTWKQWRNAERKPD